MKESFFLRFRLLVNILYSYSYPKNENVHISSIKEDFSPIEKIVRSRVQSVAPGLRVHLIGSASFGVLGRKDLDFFIESLPQEMKKNSKRLSEVLGYPRREKSDHVEWEIYLDGWNVEIVLIDPKSSKYREQMMSSAILKSDKELLDEYRRLKLNLDGSPIRVYERKKILFFFQIRKERELDFEKLLKRFYP